MSYASHEVSRLTYEERAAIIRRAQALRAQEIGTLLSALSRRVRRALAHFAPRGQAVEQIDIPRSPSSAIF